MSCKTLSCCILVAAIFAGTVTPARAATPEQIDQAVDAGKKFLYSTQLGDGTWEGIVPGFKTNTLQEGGVTCMCVYALLTAGESEKDPRLAKAIRYVTSGDIKGTYSFGFQALALNKMSQTPEVKRALQKVGKHLLEGGERKGIEGLYFYNSATTGDTFDFSNSQYGALGMWACADAGLEVPDKYWEDVQSAWRKYAQKDGGWQYAPNAEKAVYHTTASMTSAGIATLFIADDQLSYKSSGDCRGNINDTFIDNGIKWITARMNVIDDLYTWYGIERIGIASGYKYFGNVDWFKVGANELVKDQAADGSWAERASKEVGTSYAILFLVRGKAPIIMNKLRYEKNPTDASPVDGPWNERNRDAAGAAKYIGDQLESFMNWQVVTLDIDPDEFHDSPILYLAGNEALHLSPAQEAKLKRFVEDGGLLLGNADCGTTAFSDSFRALGKRLVDGQYEFRKLPADHPIFTHQQFLANKWKSPVALEGLSNGVRELAVLIPVADPSRAWQSKQFKSKQDSFELIADIYLYSIDRQNIAEKGVTYIVRPDPKITASKTIKVARLQYTGNWDPEPGGWRRLAAIMHNQNKIDLTITPVKLGAGQLAGYTIAHLTGTAAIHFDSAATDELKKFVASGGTLIVDAAGGSAEFADSAEKELTALFGDDAPVSFGSPILNGLASADFHYRSYARQVSKGAIGGSSIRAIQINQRPAIIFTAEDISAGLVGENVDGINGYTPETSVALMSSLIQATLKKPATTQPAATQP